MLRIDYRKVRAEVGEWQGQEQGGSRQSDEKRLDFRYILKVWPRRL